MDIKFSFNLDTEIPTGPAYYAYKHGYIEGSLSIYINEKLFFHEPCINVVEFGIQLGEWLQRTQSG